jgi:hypothetical protein
MPKGIKFELLRPLVTMGQGGMARRRAPGYPSLLSWESGPSNESGYRS